MASSGIGERGSRDRSSDSNDHNSDDEAGGLSGAEDEDGGHPADQTGQSADGKTGKARKKKTRTVFSRSQVCKIYIWKNYHGGPENLKKSKQKNS